MDIAHLSLETACTKHERFWREDYDGSPAPIGEDDEDDASLVVIRADGTFATSADDDTTTSAATDGGGGCGGGGSRGSGGGDGEGEDSPESPQISAAGRSHNPHTKQPRSHRPRRLIALFGSSLNPVTRGHIAIVRALLQEKRGRHFLHVNDQERNDDDDDDTTDGDAVSRGADATVNDPRSAADASEPLFDEVWVGPVYSHPDVEKYRHLADMDTNDRTPEQEEQFEIYVKKRQLRDNFEARVALCRVGGSSAPVDDWLLCGGVCLRVLIGPYVRAHDKTPMPPRRGWFNVCACMVLIVRRLPFAETPA